MGTVVGMRGWWQDLTDLVLPAECGGCGRPRTVLCPECRAVLSGAAPRRVRPAPEPPGLPVVYASARYGDEVRAVLLAHKERGALALAGPLGAALAGAVRAGLRQVRARAADGGAPLPGPSRAWRGEAEAPVLLVPVPSGRGAVRARGHDPARRIAFAAAAELRRTGTPARVLAVLRQRRAVADQAGLNSRQRLGNLAGALAVAPGGGRLLLGGPVVLVDDLMTTGASLTEAARAVRAATAATAATVGTVGPAGPRAPSITYGGVLPGAYGDVATAVYTGVAREGGEERMERMERWERTAGSPEGSGDVICAAVVAATPEAFEINRN